MKNNKSCLTCKYAHKERLTTCRRYPPQTFYVDDQGENVQAITVFPTVNQDGWYCHEYKRGKRK